MTRLVLPGGIVAYGKTGAHYGCATGVGATRDLSRTRPPSRDELSRSQHGRVIQESCEFD
ncbi:hypothetical protein ACQEVF_22385 [Nonomuraea polychroma]|uniref:hypothetical protein n=1 Tax=Nonomuraea polychroma TaxID=46176 RepID=UPI003D919367